MSAALHLSLDDATLTRLGELASDRQMTPEAVVLFALETFLDDEIAAERQPLEPWQREQIEEGRLAASRGEFASPEEVEAFFRQYGE